MPVAVPTVSHVALLTAVQVHVDGDAVTVVDAVSPVAGTFCPVGAIEYVQLLAAWVTVNVWPATVTVPVR